MGSTNFIKSNCGFKFGRNAAEWYLFYHTNLLLLYISADSRLWQRDTQPEPFFFFCDFFFRKALKWCSSVALFVSGITSACFCRICQHRQVYSPTIEYQRASLRILPIENYDLPFMRPKIPYLSSLLVTCHQSSRLYGVIMHTSAVLVEATFYSEFVEWLAFPPDGQNFHLQGLELYCTL